MILTWEFYPLTGGRDKKCAARGGALAVALSSQVGSGSFFAMEFDVPDRAFGMLPKSQLGCAGRVRVLPAYCREESSVPVALLKAKLA